MEEKLHEILMNLNRERITVSQAQEQILEIVDWVRVYDKTPPILVELLAKAPDGTIHLTTWRPAYDIFCCQSKGEGSNDWQWKLV